MAGILGTENIRHACYRVCIEAGRDGRRGKNEQNVSTDTSPLLGTMAFNKCVK